MEVALLFMMEGYMLTLQTVFSATLVTTIIAIILGTTQRADHQTQNVLGAYIAAPPPGITIYNPEMAVNCQKRDGDVVLTITKEGVVINGEATVRANLETQLRRTFADRGCKMAFVKATPNLTWGEVVPVIDALRGAGVLSIMMTDKLRREMGYQIDP